MNDIITLDKFQALTESAVHYWMKIVAVQPSLVLANVSTRSDNSTLELSWTNENLYLYIDINEEGVRWYTENFTNEFKSENGETSLSEDIPEKLLVWLRKISE